MTTTIALFPALAILAAIVFAAMAAAKKRPSAQGAYRAIDPLNGTEKKVLAALTSRCPSGSTVLACVRLADIVAPTSTAAKQARADLNRVQSKHVDFAIYNVTTGAVSCVVEIDGPTHDRKSSQATDRVKDAALSSAGVRLVRAKASSWDNAEFYRKVFSDERNEQIPRPVQSKAQG
jgi:hypothetical protein